MPAIKRFAMVGVIVAVTLGGSELSSRMVVYHLTPTGAASPIEQRQAFLATLPGAAGDQTMSDSTAGDHGTRRFIDMAYGARYEIHPYFGHVFFRNYASANNHGFYTPQRFPYHKRAHEYVIGIFGGSVAMQVAGDAAHLRERLLPALHERGYDEVTILSFAVGAWRQPQTFNAIVYYLDMVDMILEVDGLNEMFGLMPPSLGSYPTRFPLSEVFVPLAQGERSPYQMQELGKLTLASEWVAAFTRSTLRRPLRHSALVHLIWKVVAIRYTDFAAAIRGRLIPGVASEWSDVEPVENGNLDAIRLAYREFFERTVRAADRVASDAGKAFFQFVQPNQHVPGGKPLSELERTQYFSPQLSEIVSVEYPAYEAMSARLRGAGVESTYLGKLFATTPDTVYTDACCHFNERGVRTVVDAVADHVLASPRFAAVAPAR